ncbi:hypothetical protein OROHE_016153 [Orobanche hederae]
MAAYAGVVSLMHIIDNLQNHSRPPITLHKEQAHLLTQKLTFLQQFLEIYNPTLDYSKEADPLESRIARAAYAAEDAIESHIFFVFNNNSGEKMSCSDGLCEALEKVIQDMELTEEVAMEIKETVGFRNRLRHTKSTLRDPSRSISSIAEKKTVMVGFNDLLLEMKARLTADARDLQTLPIVGMGGSGKTTLALNIYQDGLINEHFDIRAWVTVSQEYSILEILTQLLTQLIGKGKPNQGLREGELGDMLHKHLYGRKYMIVLDDMWSIEAWDGVRRFLPNNKNGSRIIITTRLTTLALALPNSNSLGMKPLDEDDSWDLLSKTVFGEKGCCPPEFEKIGKKIGNSCRGLPLSIVVIGGLLAKSEHSIEYWENMEENLNAIVNSDDDESCLKILYMSYKQLPVHLKPCFLYMGIYREDHVIRIPELVKLWVAEGFLKPVSGKSLEDVARVYLKDLVYRNLILIHKLGKTESIKECKVHDLLRDLCLREAEKQGFYNVGPRHEIGDRVGRIVMSGTNTMAEIEEVDALSSAPLARSLILNFDVREGVPPCIFRLMRIVQRFYAQSNEFLENAHQLVNLRSFGFNHNDIEFPSSIWQFWNLQTLTVNSIDHMYMFIVPTEIWHMSHLRHLHFRDLRLPDPPPPSVQANGMNVLGNLQTLGRIRDFTCSEQMVKTIPNIRKLEISYDDDDDDDRFRLTNLDCLDKLESLKCDFYRSTFPINFPRSLKKLILWINTSKCWQGYILDKIGDLPLLQKLQLDGGNFKEGEWETSEGQFRSLKFLSLRWCEDLQVWTSEASHFPRLEQLRLRQPNDLEIPLNFADIPTLRFIELEGCGNSVIRSAKRILEEQEALYGEEESTLQVHVFLFTDNPGMRNLASRNFHVRI